jgi:hypothetical protein
MAEGTGDTQSHGRSKLNATASEAKRWTDYLSALPWQLGQLDEATYHAFLRAGSLGISADGALEIVLDRISRSGGQIRVRKIESQLRRAYAYTRTSASLATHELSKRTTWPEADHNKIGAITRNGPSLHDLWERSPVRFEDSDSHAEEIIDNLFPGNPLLCVGWSNSCFATQTRDQWRGQLADAQFIVSSHMTALLGHTKEGKLSFHTLNNTGPRRFLVVEFDAGTFDDQAALLDYLASRGPLVLVVHSGAKSLHGWFWCAGVDSEILRRFVACAVRLGADKATWLNHSQFVRMPDGTRAGGNRQSVYYFNPELCAK